MGFTAVSYTHLDVYKRQAKELKKATQEYEKLLAEISGEQREIVRHSTIGREKSSVCEDDSALLQKFFTKQSFVDAVSYTHLDVYKRQAEGRDRSKY